ncbi:MAG: hypothetical protein R2729_27655 [Bryobacteraceae bacterium]
MLKKLSIGAGVLSLAVTGLFLTNPPEAAARSRCYAVKIPAHYVATNTPCGQGACAGVQWMPSNGIGSPICVPLDFQP